MADSAWRYGRPDPWETPHDLCRDVCPKCGGYTDRYSEEWGEKCTCNPTTEGGGEDG